MMPLAQRTIVARRRRVDTVNSTRSDARQAGKSSKYSEKARSFIARPLTLFTGQWAELTFEQLCAKAKSFGYDGEELACWGDHFDVDQCLMDQDYAKARWHVLRM